MIAPRDGWRPRIVWLPWLQIESDQSFEASGTRARMHRAVAAETCRGFPGRVPSDRMDQTPATHRRSPSRLPQESSSHGASSRLCRRRLRCPATSTTVKVPSPSLWCVHVSGSPRRRASSALSVRSRRAIVSCRSCVMSSRCDSETSRFKKQDTAFNGSRTMLRPSDRPAQAHRA